MGLRNSEDSYGAISKLFHWGLAILIIGALGLGLYMTSSFPPDFGLYGIHKSLGVLILALAVLRVVWKFSNVAPRLLGIEKTWEKWAARSVHAFLYIAMLGMPLSGWLMSSSQGYPVKFFGLFTLPKIFSKQPEGSFWRELFTEIHELLAYTLIAVIVLHVAAALRHHISLKDRTLLRMLPGKWIALGFSVFLSASIITSPACAGQYDGDVVPIWKVDYSKSSISFSGQQMAVPFDGAFLKYEADIGFHTDILESSYANVRFDIDHIDTKMAERDTTLKGSSWFDIDNFPHVTFTSTNFKHVKENDYKATGDLMVRGVKHEISFPFNLKFSKQTSGQRMVEMTSSFTLDRLKLNLGRGDWADSSIIGQFVPVKLHLYAMAQ